MCKNLSDHRVLAVLLGRLVLDLSGCPRSPSPAGEGERERDRSRDRSRSLRPSSRRSPPGELVASVANSGRTGGRAVAFACSTSGVGVYRSTKTVMGVSMRRARPIP